jgi:hydrogenase nickel incorporation protein HypB
MFRKADIVLLTKVDLLPALPDFDRGALEEALARVMPAPRLLDVSARSGTGIAEWVAFLEALRGDAAGVAAFRPAQEAEQPMTGGA